MNGALSCSRGFHSTQPHPQANALLSRSAASVNACVTQPLATALGCHIDVPSRVPSLPTDEEGSNKLMLGGLHTVAVTRAGRGRMWGGHQDWLPGIWLGFGFAREYAAKKEAVTITVIQGCSQRVAVACLASTAWPQRVARPSAA
jgi:hypothetical protein